MVLPENMVESMNELQATPFWHATARHSRKTIIIMKQ